MKFLMTGAQQTVSGHHSSKMDDTVMQGSGGAHAQQTRAFATSAVIILTILLLFWNKRRKASQRLHLPPGPRGWPVLGSLLSLGTLPHRTLRNLATTYGPIMYMHLGRVPTVVVSNADMAKEFLKTHDMNMSSRPTQIISSTVTYNKQDVVFAPYGPVWRTARKICTLQLLTVSRISKFQDTREREVRARVQTILEESQNEAVLRMGEVFGNMTMNITTEIMWQQKRLGIKGKMQSHSADHATYEDFGKLFRDLLSLIGTFNLADFFPAVFKPLFMTIQGLNKRLEVVHGRLDSLFDDVIRQHQDRELLSGTQSLTPNDKDDFVGVLSKLSKTGEISPTMMKALLLDMLIAGTHTTAVTLEWALAEIMKHPLVLTRAQDELNSVVGPDRLVKEDDIPRLKYLQAVVKETFRMHPPAVLSIPRESVEDCDIANFHIPAKTLIYINVYAIHRDPKVYERPEEFDPDRFLRMHSAIDFKGTDYDLIPFGAGRRICPGVNLAASTVHLGLAQMLHAFTWTLPDHQKPEEIDMTEMFGAVVDMANPLSVLAKPRLRHEVYYRDM